MMGLLKTQRVYDQCANTLEVRNFLIGDGFHIRDISEAAKAETKDRELVVHHLNRLYLNVAYPEYVMLIYCVYVQLWDTRVQVFSKAIWHRSVESVNSTLIGIDINITKLAKRTQVVESSHMIVVDMGKQDTISDLATIRSNATNAVQPTDKFTYNGTQYTVSELLQLTGLLPGTFDVADLLCYLVPYLLYMSIILKIKRI